MVETALVHEWFATHGGSENVAETLADTLDDPDVFCLWREDPHRLSQFRVTESRLARVSAVRTHKAMALPLMPATWRRFDLSRYDRILVSSHLFAHHVGSAPGVNQTNVYVYVHSPARYIWEPDLDQRANSLVTKLAAPVLRRLDASRVPRRASFASNSDFVRKRVLRSWGVDSIVVPPPVDVRAIQVGRPWADQLGSNDEKALQALPTNYILGASRFVRYKRLEEAINLGEDLGLPVVLAGGGPDRARLEGIARDATVPVTFISSPTTALLRALLERAELYVFAAIEDFGIMPVEAMALGTPVIVNDIGGARESVELVEGGFATVFDSKSERLAAASRALALDPSKMAQSAGRYDTAVFRCAIRKWLDRTETSCLAPRSVGICGG